MIRISACLIVLLSLAFTVPRCSQAAVVYLFNFDGSDGTVAPGPGDAVPQGASVDVGESTYIITPDPPGLQGGNALSQRLGAAWPNKQGVRIGNGPVIQNAWTIEAVVRPDLSGCSYGKALTSYVFNSYTQDSYDMGDVSLSVDQNTGIVTFSPWGNTLFGKITSSVSLKSGMWYHIAVVVRMGLPQQTELWINGSLDGAGNYPSGWETQGQYRIPSHFRIGGWDYTTTGRNWQGEIDAVCISDTALATGSFALLSGPLPALYGHVELSGYAGDASQIGLEIQFRAPDGTHPPFVERVFLDSAGNYTVPLVPSGTYDLLFRACGSIAQVMPDITIPSARVDVALVNGDADGDNEITTTDLSIVLTEINNTGNQ